MKWTEIQRWAKDQGYTVGREKVAPRQYLYSWSKDDVTGEECTVRSFAKAVFNHLSNNRWLEHQENYVAPIKEFKI